MQTSFRSSEEELYLSLLRTCDILSYRVEQLLKKHDITPAQYNVLRILRGAGEEGLPCTEISQRLVTRVPDVTRLLDRLERRELVTRSRETRDRRVVRATISEEGGNILSSLDSPMQELHAGHFSSLTQERRERVLEELEAIRQHLEEELAS